MIFFQIQMIQIYQAEYGPYQSLQSLPQAVERGYYKKESLLAVSISVLWELRYCTYFEKLRYLGSQDVWNSVRFFCWYSMHSVALISA